MIIIFIIKSNYHKILSWINRPYHAKLCPLIIPIHISHHKKPQTLKLTLISYPLISVRLCMCVTLSLITFLPNFKTILLTGKEKWIPRVGGDDLEVIPRSWYSPIEHKHFHRIPASDKTPLWLDRLKQNPDNSESCLKTSKQEHYSKQ